MEGAQDDSWDIIIFAILEGNMPPALQIKVT